MADQGKGRGRMRRASRRLSGRGGYAAPFQARFEAGCAHAGGSAGHCPCAGPPMNDTGHASMRRTHTRRAFRSMHSIQLR